MLSEDEEHSYRRHSSTPRQESKKRHPNKEVVRKLMKLTFERRRSVIRETSQLVSEILKEHPFLGDDKEVSCSSLKKTVLVSLLLSSFLRQLKNLKGFAVSAKTTALRTPGCRGCREY